MEGLKIRYNALCMNYMSEFCNLIGCKDAQWQNGEPGKSIIIDNRAFSFDVVRYCVDNNISKDKLYDWYLYVVEKEKFATYTLDEWIKSKK